MKKAHRIVALLLCVLLLLSGLPAAWALEEETVVESTPAESTELPTQADNAWFADLSPEEQLEYLLTLETEEECQALLDTLSPEQLAALRVCIENYNASLVDNSRAPDFTEAGPFLSVVKAAAPRAAVSNDGITTLKTATDNGDGTYKIRLESYTTGTTTTLSYTKPVDFVLVLDQSGSMFWSKLSDGTIYQAAMQNAVNQFITQVNKKYDAAYSNHRISLVKFNQGAQIVSDWTFVDTAGKNALQDKINNLPETNLITDTAAGMTLAQSQITKSNSYHSNVNPFLNNRQKVVILFSDGVPYEGDASTVRRDTDDNITTQMTMTNANSAISTAKKLKDAGVTVYTIGIFDGADANELYGKNYMMSSLFGGDKPNPCDGQVKSIWGYSNWKITDYANDFGALEVPACNRLLNFISSNFSGATQLGVKYHGGDKNANGQDLGEQPNKTTNHLTYTPFAKGYWFEITKNFTRSRTGYYLTARNTSALNNIFKNISGNIEQPDISLGTKTVVKDVVSQYFEIPEGATITLKYANYDGTGAQTDPANWTEYSNPSGVTATVTGNTVEVTGFDYSKYYVTTDRKSSYPYYGRKLIIEFTVQPKEGFLGGNGVPTNEDTSGIYSGDALMESFTVPTVDVAIPEISLTTPDINVYLLHTLTRANVNSVVSAKAGTLELWNPSGGIAWQDDYAKVTCSYSGSLTDMTTDRLYNVDLKVEPRSAGSAAAVTKTASGRIMVFLPTITWQDSQLNYGASPNYETENYVSVQWEHGASNAATSTMTGTEPQLTFTYSPTPSAFTEETPVKVTAVALDGKTAPAVSVTFLHADCDFSGCKWGQEGFTDCQFIVHMKTMDLEIRKTGCEAIDENQAFVFHIVGADTGVDLYVTVHGNGSVLVRQLPVGAYTVTEDSGWSWRYTPENETQQVTSTSASTTVTFRNQRGTEANNWKWLNGSNWCDNRWIDGRKEQP